MIKRFFITLLGTIAGFWISLALIFIIGIGVVGALVSNEVSTKVEVPKKSVLYLDLSGEITERSEIGDIWEIIQDGIPSGESLMDILNAIKLAKNDSKIEGIYINAAGSAAGYATREEIVNALEDFKSSGKWIYAYGDSYTQGDYILASVADSVFVNPVGSVDIHGCGSQLMFYKGVLDKLGVKINIVRVGTYKSAVEPFMTTEMSAASREQTQVMLDSIWQYCTEVISSNRNVAKSEINNWADSIIATWSSESLKSSGAVTALEYRRKVENLMKDLTDKDTDDKLELISPSSYMQSQKTFSANKDHIAVLFATGDIVDDGKGGIVGSVMAPQIVELADNDNVKALVLRVNSGGGSGFASEQIWEALEYFKSKGKPFYVSMGDYAASGGYYISCGADRIYADRTTLTGSIGVFGIVPNFSELITDKIGITFSTVETNPNVFFPDVMTPISQSQLDALQHSVENFYELFTRRVAEGRNIPQDDVKKIAEGRVWIGGDALKLGLIDELGGIESAIKAIANNVEMKADDVVYYPIIEDKLLMTILANARQNVSSGELQLNIEAAKAFNMLRKLKSMNPIQAKMPEISIQ